MTFLTRVFLGAGENKQPTFECMAENTDMVHASNGACTPFTAPVSFMANTTADGRDWLPEPPQMVGVFHAYVKSFNNDLRAHKLYIVCSGGCPSLADKFYNLYTDTKHLITCTEFLDSEESWYLKVIIGPITLCTHTPHLCKILAGCEPAQQRARAARCLPGIGVMHSDQERPTRVRVRP